MSPEVREAINESLLRKRDAFRTARNNAIAAQKSMDNWLEAAGKLSDQISVLESALTEPVDQPEI